MRRSNLKNLSLHCNRHINNFVRTLILRNLDVLGLILIGVFGLLVDLLRVMGFVSLRDLLDDPGLLSDSGTESTTWSFTALAM